MHGRYHTFWKFATFDHKPFFELAKPYTRDAKTIVDLGPGNGAFAQAIGRQDVYLLEGNEQSAMQLRTAYPNARHYAVGQPMPFTDATVDVVHCSHIVEHLEVQQLYDLLKEIDRVLRPSGVLIISAPASYSDFYNDLSHTKPYHPAVFIKYLVTGNPSCATRPLISSAYSKEKLVWRYTFTQLGPRLGARGSFLDYPFFLWHALSHKLGIGRYERSGFTLILKKGI